VTILINKTKQLLAVDNQPEDRHYFSNNIGFESRVLVPDVVAPLNFYPVANNAGNAQSNVLAATVVVKLVYTTAQIVKQLTTSWGSGDTATHFWAASTATPSTPKAIISFGINTVSPTNFSAFGVSVPAESKGLVAMTALQVATARLSFHLWDSLIASSLVETGGAGANITLNYSSATSGGGTYSQSYTSSNNSIVADQVWMSSTWASNADSGMVSGGYGFNTMMHEIGHALGLSHPGLYDASSGGVITYDANASFSQDNRQYTMMSYFGGYNTTTNMWVQDGTSLSYKYSQTPMVYDIAAIQSLYGADTTTRTGDTIYGYHNNFAANDTEKAIFDFSINTIPLCTIWDAGGSNDTLDCSGWSGGQVIDLTPGNYSSVRGLSNNVGIAFNTIIEKAIGGIGNDKLVGNSVNNTLDGGAGADTMLGGLGNDTYYVDNTGDVVTENISAGIDVVSSTISYTLTANVENLILTGTAAINGTGNILNNQLTGNSANNTLDGGTGADTMLGGLGNDTYYVDNTGDVVTENTSAGIDVVSSIISYTLTANVENLILTGATAINGTGNADANTLTGNSADNILSGQAGNDVLIGGAGADTLVGGLGKDSYNLAETTTATDTVRIATGDSLASMGNYDLISGFKLGAGVVSTAGVDKLDLVSTFIATKAVAVNGIDSGVIMSHSINNGIISFDDINNYTAPLTITATHLSSVFSYLQANIKSSNTVGFISEGNTFVFQDAGVIDTLVELVGVVASSISTTGLATNSLWIA
jgi:hypothetical protein